MFQTLQIPQYLAVKKEYFRLVTAPGSFSNFEKQTIERNIDSTCDSGLHTF